MSMQKCGNTSNTQQVEDLSGMNSEDLLGFNAGLVGSERKPEDVPVNLTCN
jgi:hypothetical protein